jgi:hypothetical protein
MTRKEFAKIIGDITERHYNSKCDCCKNGDDIDMNVLLELESLGMGPPYLDKIKSAVVQDVYIYPEFRMWDDDFEKDKLLVNALERYRKRKGL